MLCELQWVGIEGVHPLPRWQKGQCWVCGDLCCCGVRVAAEREPAVKQGQHAVAQQGAAHGSDTDKGRLVLNEGHNGLKTQQGRHKR